VQGRGRGEEKHLVDTTIVVSGQASGAFCHVVEMQMERSVLRLMNAANLSSHLISGMLSKPVRSKARKIVILILGWGFVLFGILGLFLPILQGVLFLLVGLLLLSTEYVWAHRLLEKLRARWPWLGSHAEKAQATAQKWLDKIFGQAQ